MNKPLLPARKAGKDTNIILTFAAAPAQARLVRYSQTEKERYKAACTTLAGRISSLRLSQPAPRKSH